MRTLLWCLLLLLGSFTAAPGQAAPVPEPSVESKLAEFYGSLAEEGRLNGNVIVASHGKFVYQHSFGYADFEHKRPNTADTAFQLASLSKPFTAIAILQLVEAGKLRLSDGPSRFLPAFPYPEITIAQLLSHTSGFSDQDLAKPLAQYEKRLGHRHDNAELIRFLATDKVAFKLKPGEKWWYSNLGYEVLAEVVEKVSGESLAAYIQRHIAAPLGMAHTYLLTSPAHRRPYQARNYDYAKPYSVRRELVDQKGDDYTERAFGHSNVVSTAGDLIKLAEAYFHGKLVSDALVSQSLSGFPFENGEPDRVWLDIGGMGPTVDGFGWFVFTKPEMQGTVFHAGGMKGAVTILLHDMRSDSTVVVLDNVGSEGVYKNAQNGLRILKGEAIQPARRNLARLYGRELAGRGPDAAAALLFARMTDTLHYALSENDMNNLGYALLEDKRLKPALEVFKMNCLLYPTSDNVFNSYAEALAQASQRERAMEMYRRSLELNPKNEDSAQALKRLLEATDKLNRRGVVPTEGTTPRFAIPLRLGTKLRGHGGLGKTEGYRAGASRPLRFCHSSTERTLSGVRLG